MILSESYWAIILFYLLLILAHQYIMIIVISVFILLYAIIFIYKTTKRTRHVLLFKRELSKLLRYFEGRTKCTSIDTIQGKNKNFYNVVEYQDYFYCTLWNIKESITIIRNDTFENVRKDIQDMIDASDKQLYDIFIKYY